MYVLRSTIIISMDFQWTHTNAHWQQFFFQFFSPFNRIEMCTKWFDDDDRGTCARVNVQWGMSENEKPIKHFCVYDKHILTKQSSTHSSTNELTQELTLSPFDCVRIRCGVIHFISEQSLCCFTSQNASMCWYVGVRMNKMLCQID